MATKLATPVRNAAYILFEHGFTVKETQKALDKLKRPSRGYVYLSDVMSIAMKKETTRKKNCIDCKKAPRKKSKKVQRKTNPHKKSSRKVKYLIFNWNDYELAFLHATNQWVNRRVALRFTTKAQAAKIARTAARQSRDLIGVAPSSMTNAQIIIAAKDGCISAMRKKGAAPPRGKA